MSESAIEPIEPAAEPVEPTETAATEPAVEPVAWSVSQQDWENLHGTVQALAQTLTPTPQAPREPAFNDFFTPDPVSGEIELTADGIEKYLDTKVQHRLDQALGNYTPVLNQTVADRGEQIIQGKLDSLQGTVGAFDKQLARELAEGYASTGSMHPDEAIQRGAQRAAEFAKAEREAGVAEFKTTLSNIGEAPHEPGAAGAAVSEFRPRSGADGYKDVADNWAARHRIPA